MVSSTTSCGHSTLRTPRLTLRPARGSDVYDFFELFSDPDVMRYWSTAPHTEISQTQLYLDGMVSARWNGSRDFVIELRQTDQQGEKGKVIGKAGLWDGREIGFLLSRSYWHQGFMSEAFAAFLPHIWTTTSSKASMGSFTATGNVEEKDVEATMVLDDIFADVDPRNDASIGILKKFGFVETGRKARTYATHLGWCDSVYLSLKRPECN